MKKRVFKRAMAYVCAITMLVATMADVNFVSVKADTVTTIIAEKAPERAALIAEIQNADYNFALNKEAAVSNLTTAQGGTDLSVITNGKFELGNSPATTIEIGKGSTDPTWLEVDLGAAYDSTAIDRVVAQYRTGNSGYKTEYFIQFSLNGTDYVDVAQVNNVASGSNQIYLDKITLTDEQKAAMPYTKYVRIYSTTNSSAYGLMTKGMAVLTDGTKKVSEVEALEQEKPAEASSLTVTTSDYGQLEYSFEAAEGHDDYTYIAYVNGVSKGNVVPGEEYVVTNLAAGAQTVKIVSVKDGVRSDGIEKTVDVQDSKSLISSERNIAVGKSVDVSSIRESDVPANLTDGNITSVFRFVATDTKAAAVIDLGEYYNPDILDRAILLFTAGRYTTEYTVDYSLNGITFTTVAEANNGSRELQDSKIDASAYTLDAVRYVRFSLTKPVAPQGFQLYELALITKEGADLTPVEVETLDNPAALQVTSSAYGQLEYTFEAAAGHDDYEYVAFVNGASQGTVVPGEKYVLTDLLTGTYTVKVFSVKGDLGSSGLVESVDVEDVKALITKERNVAVGKPATSNSVRKTVTYDPEHPDDPEYATTVLDDVKNLTDGSITTLFRTLETDLTAEFVIDLEKDYKPAAFERLVMLFAANRYAKAYTVEYSATGEEGTYELVAEVTDQTRDFTTTTFDVSAYTAETVRFVKINLSDAVEPNYGFQCYEVAMVENFIDVADATVTFDEENYYTGEAIAPAVKVEYDGAELTADKDYTVEYADNTEVGTAKITVAGIGRFNGVVEKTFEIAKKPMDKCFVVVDFDKDNNLAVTAKNGELELVEGVDFEYTVAADEDGNVVVTVAGKGDHYAGEYKKTFALPDLPVNEAADLTVTSEAVNEIVVSFANADKLGAEYQTYNIYIGDILVDETVEAGEYRYTERVAGTHTVKVVAVLGERTSDGVTAEVTVKGMDIAGKDISITVPDVAPVYSGSAVTVPVTVKQGDAVLEADKDYTVEFTNNVNAGTAKFTVTGKGLYEGKAEGTFVIAAKALKDADVKAVFNKETLVVTVADGTKALVKGTDYDVTTTKGAKNTTVTVTGKGNYTGKIVKTVANPVKAPAKVKINKVTPKKKAAKVLKVSLKKLKNVKGYEVRVSTTKNGKKVVVKKLVKKIKVKIKSKKLKGKKKLFVSARAYVLDGKKKVFGKWGAAKKVSVK